MPAPLTGTVTGTYPVGTTLLFDPVPDLITDGVTIVTLASTNVSVGSSGTFAQVLTATNDPAYSPINWSYHVTGSGPSGDRFDFFMAVPSGITTNLATVPQILESAGVITIPIPYVDVRGYVKGDGVTDDTVAFQSAITAAYNKVLLIPANMIIAINTGSGPAAAILVLSPIRIEFGPGAGLKGIGGSFGMMEVRSDDVTIVGGHIQANGFTAASRAVLFLRGNLLTGGNRMAVDGTKVTNTVIGSKAISAWDVNDLTIKNATTSGTYIGIHAQAIGQTVLRGCRIIDCNVEIANQASGLGIIVDITEELTGRTWDDVLIEGNTVIGPNVSGLQNLGITAFFLSDNVRVIGNSVRQCDYGISVTADNMVVTSNSVERAWFIGIELANCPAATCVGNTVTEGNIAANNSSAIAGQVIIANNYIDGNTSTLVRSIHTSSVPQVVIEGNIIKSNGSNTTPAILVANGDDAVITGNQIMGASSSTEAILVSISASGKRSVIVGNAIENVTANGVKLDAASAFTHDLVYSGNSFQSGAGVEWSLNNITLTSTSRVSVAAADHMFQRYIELSELSADAAAGATNHGRLYMKDNGAGKTQFVVRFPTGAVQVIATEP